MHRGDKIVLITPTQQSQSDEQVRVEARILFRLELPSHKSIGVKAKQGKTVAEVILITVLTIVLIVKFHFEGAWSNPAAIWVDGARGGDLP